MHNTDIDAAKLNGKLDILETDLLAATDRATCLAIAEQAQAASVATGVVDIRPLLPGTDPVPVPPALWKVWVRAEGLSTRAYDRGRRLV